MTTDTESDTRNESVTEKAKSLKKRDDLNRDEKVARLEQFTAGITHKAGAKDEAELVQGLHDLANEHGEPVTANKMREHGRFAVQTYINHFDLKWAEIVEEYGHESG